ncbi:MAG: hypothetical protein NTY03_01945 [Candidatus Bathyarchaeota archaeon]|nr:hypothetical protein [Candidatus Bathyarchaeota archaeon]
MGKSIVSKKKEEVIIIDVDKEEENRDWLRTNKVKKSDKGA